MHEKQWQRKEAWGTDSRGVRRRVLLPQWAKAHSFWGVWETCHHLSATSGTADQSAGAPARVSARQLQGARAGSRVEQRAILETQMQLGAEAVLSLAEAQLVLCSPDDAESWPSFPSSHAAARWAAVAARLPYDPVYLDFTSADRRRAIAMDMPDGRRSWQMSAAMVEDDGGALRVTVFGAPVSAGDEPVREPPSVPQGRVLFGTPECLREPGMGEVAVDVIAGETYAREVRDPRSEIVARAAACFFLSVVALRALAHITDGRVELVPAVRDPKARRQAKARGELMPLIPRKRR